MFSWAKSGELCQQVLPGGLLNFFALFWGKQQEGKGGTCSFSGGKLSPLSEIALCYLVRFSETVTGVKWGKSREYHGWKHKSLQIKAFGCSCVIAAELSSTRCSPACCASYHPSLGAKMLMLFETRLLSCCPHHPAATTGPSGNRAARMGDYSGCQFLPWSSMQRWSFINSEKSKYCAPPLLPASGQQFLKYFPWVLCRAAYPMANCKSQ